MDHNDADAEVAGVNRTPHTHHAPAHPAPRPGSSSGGGMRLNYLSSRFPKRCGTSISDRRRLHRRGLASPTHDANAAATDARPRAQSAVSYDSGAATPQPHPQPQRMCETKWSRDVVSTPEPRGCGSTSRGVCRTPFSATGSVGDGDVLGGLNDVLMADYVYQHELFTGVREQRAVMNKQLTEQVAAFESREESARVSVRLDEGAARSKLFVAIAEDAARAKKQHRQWLREQRRKRNASGVQRMSVQPEGDTAIGGSLLGEGLPGTSQCRSRSPSEVSVVSSAGDVPVAADPLIDFHENIYDFDFLDAFARDHAHLVLAEAPWDRDGPMGRSYLKTERHYAELYRLLANAPRQQLARSFWAEEVVRENATPGCNLRDVLRDDMVKYNWVKATGALCEEEAGMREKVEAVAWFVLDHLQRGLREVLLGTLLRAQITLVEDEAVVRAEMCRLEQEDRAAYGKWREIRGLVAAEEDDRVDIVDEEKIERSVLVDTEHAEKPSSVRLHAACGPDTPICTACGFETTVRFCGVTGEPHCVDNRCPTCGLPLLGTRFCPATGEPHERMFEWGSSTARGHATTLFRAGGPALCARPMRPDMYHAVLHNDAALPQDALTGEFMHMVGPKMVMELCFQLHKGKGYSLPMCDQIYAAALAELGVEYDLALLPSVVYNELPSSDEEEVVKTTSRRDKGAASVAGGRSVASKRSSRSRDSKRSRNRSVSRSGSSSKSYRDSEGSDDDDDNKSRKRSVAASRSWSKKKSVVGGDPRGAKKSIVGGVSPKKSIVGTPGHYASKKSIVGGDPMRAKKSIVATSSPPPSEPRKR